MPKLVPPSLLATQLRTKSAKNDIRVARKPNGVLHSTTVRGHLTLILRQQAPRKVHQMGVRLMGTCGLSEHCSLWTAEPGARSLPVVLRGGRWQGGVMVPGVVAALLLVVALLFCYLLSLLYNCGLGRN